MAWSFNGSSDSLRSTSTPQPATAFPATIACWGKKTATGANGTMLGMFGGSASNRWVRILMGGDGTVTGDTNSTGTDYQAATTTATYTAGVWTHVACVFTANNSRTIYLDGANAVTTTGTGAFSVNSRTSFGSLDRSSPTEWFDGQLAEGAIWNVALTADEIASLAKGIPPSRVRPQSLKFYCPLIRSAGELRFPYVISANGTPAASGDHPRRYG